MTHLQHDDEYTETAKHVSMCSEHQIYPINLEHITLATFQWHVICVIG